MPRYWVAGDEGPYDAEDPKAAAEVYAAQMNLEPGVTVLVVEESEAVRFRIGAERIVIPTQLRPD